MKIAICFSGELRTGVKSSNNLLNFIGDLLPDCDFFIHTWDINSYRSPLNLRIDPMPSTKVPESDFNEIFKIYKPKGILIEDQKKFWNNLILNYPGTGDLIHLWYGFYQSIELKRKYELENNFQYDVVIKLRTDCIFPPDRVLKDDIEELLNDTTKILSIRIDDIYFMSSSHIMDIASKFYENLFGNGDWPMNHFIKFMKKNNIEIINFKDKRFTIFRQEYTYLDSIEHYYYLNAINSLIFEDINFGRNSIIYTYQNDKNEKYIEFMKKNLTTIFDKESAIKYFNLNLI